MLFSLRSNYKLAFLILVFSFFSIWGFGTELLKERHITQTILTFIIFFCLFLTSRKLFLILATPYFLISWLYLPQSIVYGDISLGIIVSLYETNLSESLEYIKNFQWDVYIIWFTYLLVFILLFRTEQNRTEQNRTEQNRTEQNRTEQNRTEQNRNIYGCYLV